MRVWPAIALLIGASACGAEPGPEPESTPLGGRNVVLVVVDTLRADHLGLAGYPKDNSPFLDRLAADGLVFPRAYSGSSWTAPATASLFTSLYPDHHGVVTGLYLHEHAAEHDEVEELQVNRMPSLLRTLPEMMRQAGYRTFASVDNPNINEEMGFARGFDRFAPGSYRGAEAVNDQVMVWRDELLDPEAGPWFLYLHYMDPHRPYHLREDWYEKEGTPAPVGHIEPAARYDSEIGYLDAELEELFGSLGLPGDALVIVTSDHGEEFGDHGGSGHRVTVHEELVRVPLLMTGPPELVPRARSSFQVTTLDLMPTLRELLGLPADQVEEGVSLVPILEERAAYEELGRRILFSHRKYEGGGRDQELFLVVDGPLRLQVETGGKRAVLYDLFEDPTTQEDVAGERPRDVERLMRLLKRFQVRPKAVEREFAPARILTEDEAEELGRLGYTD